MNLPNKLTVARIALIPVFVTLFFLPFQFLKFAALGVFALASLTDFLDGYIARKRNLVTDLGKFLDPIADKMLVICALAALIADLVFVVDFTGWGYNFEYYYITIVVAVSTMIIVCRELAVSAFRIIAAGKGLTLAADKLGKIKTVLQMAALLILIPIRDIYELNEDVGVIFHIIGIAVLLLATVMTLVSGINYIVKNRHVLKDTPKDGAP